MFTNIHSNNKNYHKYSLIIFLAFFLLIGCSSEPAEDDIDNKPEENIVSETGEGENEETGEGEEEPPKEVKDIDYFLEHARFLPTDPSQMTADDISWFNQNQWTLNWKFKLNGVTLTPEQENITKIEMESLLKTYAYLVFTKPFATYIKRTLDERVDILAATTDSKQTPSALALILAYRGINSDHFKDKVLYIHLHNTDAITYANYTGERNNGKMLQREIEKEYINDAVIDSQKWDFHNSVQKDKLVQVNIRFSYSEPSYNIMNLDKIMGWDTEGGKPNRDIKFPGSKFSVDLVFHELVHTLWNWPHPKERGLDLTYLLGAMAGDLIIGWPGGANLTSIPEISAEGSNSVISIKAANMETLLGGHLPMGLEFWWFSYVGQYTLNVQYVMNKINEKVYRVELPTTGIGKIDREAPKEIPSDPYQNISWKVTYTSPPLIVDN